MIVYIVIDRYNDKYKRAFSTKEAAKAWLETLDKFYSSFFEILEEELDGGKK